MDDIGYEGINEKYISLKNRLEYVAKKIGLNVTPIILNKSDKYSDGDVYFNGSKYSISINVIEAKVGITNRTEKKLTYQIYEAMSHAWSRDIPPEYDVTEYGEVLYTEDMAVQKYIALIIEEAIENVYLVEADEAYARSL
jgi:hypothetical protein